MNDFHPGNTSSFFTNRTIRDLYTEVQKTYMANDYPWVIGFSGGKDSTATVQIVWNALSGLSRTNLNKPVFVISSDTLVETPVVVEQINKTLDQIQKAAFQKGMPFKVRKVFPKIEESFWVNLIGKGYPAPTKRFRWCTERLKINPANQFILETAEKMGEVVMILGARKSESMSRSQVMRKRRQLPGTRLYNHSSLPRAFVYTPIEEFSTDDVWTYLDLYPSPWGGNNQELISLYRRSNLSGECPLVIDTSTPSCGNSRFGCWVCTVVDQDRSMQALIKHGEEWMEPLLDFREKLAETQIPSRKHEFRDFKRRNGQMIVRKDGRLIPGPYKFEFRRSLLKDLLALQIQLRKDGPDPAITLITVAELHEIRRIWRIEESDWEDSLPKIYREVMGTELNWIEDDLGTFSVQEKAILEEYCELNNIPVQLITRLIDTERLMYGMGRRAGIYNEIHRLFSEEWESAEDVQIRVQNERSQQIELGLD